MNRSEARLEELLPLIPDLGEFEKLRLDLAGAAVPDPKREWDSSSEYSTVDKRIVTAELTARALAESEAAIRQHIVSLYADLGLVLQSFWSDQPLEPLLLLIRLGERLEEDGWIEKASRSYAAALSLSLPLPDKGPQILALRRVGRVSLAVGDFPEALSYYQRSAELARDSGDLAGEVIALTGMGNVRLLQGRWAEAHGYYSSALSLSDTGGDDDALPKARAQLYNNLGYTATQLERLDEAEGWFARALRGWAEIDSPVDLAICHHNMAHLREVQGLRSDVVSMYKQALTLPIPSRQRSVIATALASAYVQDGNLLDAELWSREAEEHAISARSPYSLGFMYQGRGQIFLARGEEDGFIFFEKALQIAREKGYQGLEAETLVDYAQLRLLNGGIEEAQAYLERAREIFHESGSVRNQARADDLLAQIAEEAPRLAAAGD